MRLFAGARPLGDFYLYPNRFAKPGDECVYHKHEHGHLAVFGPGQYRVYYRDEAAEHEVPIDEFGVAYIRPGVHHRLVFEGGAERGHVCCIFARYGEAGLFKNPQSTLG